MTPFKRKKETGLVAKGSISEQPGPRQREWVGVRPALPQTPGVAGPIPARGGFGRHGWTLGLRWAPHPKTAAECPTAGLGLQGQSGLPPSQCHGASGLPAWAHRHTIHRHGAARAPGPSMSFPLPGSPGARWGLRWGERRAQAMATAVSGNQLWGERMPVAGNGTSNTSKG